MCEKDNNGKILKIYTNDAEGKLGMTRYIYDASGTLKNKQRLYYLFDEIESVNAVTNEVGLPVQYYIYDPWGNVVNTQDDPINNLTFVGRYGGLKDWDTGFVQFQHRWYDAEVGKWISRDPIGVEGEVNVYEYSDTVGKPGSSNLYNYSQNDPINRVDPEGLEDSKKPPCSKADPLPSNCKECDDYGSEIYMGVSLKCFCKCAGDSAWSQKVRGCLACEHLRGTNPIVSHISCYAAGGISDVPVQTLRKCLKDCSVKH